MLNAVIMVALLAPPIICGAIAAALGWVQGEESVAGAAALGAMIGGLYGLVAAQAAVICNMVWWWWSRR